MSQNERRSPGRPPTNDQTPSTRSQVLETAIRQFLDRGYPLVSVDDIASASDVTKATVYYYFSSKANLFTEAMIQMMNRIGKRIETILAGTEPLYDRLLNVTRAHLNATFQLNLAAFMQGAKTSLTTEQITRIQTTEERMYHGIEQTFQIASEQQIIPNVNPTFATHCYLNLLQVGNYRDQHNQPIFTTVEESANHIVHLFWNGLIAFQNKTDG